MIVLLERAFGRTGTDRPGWLTTLFRLSMLLAVGSAVVVEVAANGGIFCVVTTPLSGTNIPLAAHLVLGACSVALVASLVVHRRPDLLSLTALLAASSLVTGLILVAVDSAVMVAVQTCTLMGSTTEPATTHFALVYFVWGVALAVLLVEVPRALRSVGIPVLRRAAQGRIFGP